jgi:predicted nucleic acid-binding protein
MKDKIFADSNVWLYLLGNDLTKKQIALRLLQQGHTISTQVLAENSNVCRRKFLLDFPTTERHIHNLITSCDIVLIQPATILKALGISQKYHFGFYDSVVIATALEAGCNILYSEDLQDGQVVEGEMTIMNPFLSNPLEPR